MAPHLARAPGRSPGRAFGRAFGRKAALAVAVAWLPLAAAAAGPAPGRHDGELCVATGAAAAQCGPADVRVGTDGELRVQVSDIVYRLQVRRTRVEVVTLHGAMQVDEFSADARWTGDTLTFTDPDKQVRYELRLPAGRRRS